MSKRKSKNKGATRQAPLVISKLPLEEAESLMRHMKAKGRFYQGYTGPDYQMIYGEGITFIYYLKKEIAEIICAPTAPPLQEVLPGHYIDTLTA